MSLKPVPVCSSCSRCTEVSIACSHCFQICCATCFNLRNDLFDAVSKGDHDADAAVRICPKCIGNVTVKQEPMEQSCTATVDRDRELCKMHGKPRKLFCLNCLMCICGDCLGEEEEHEMHHIDNMVVVYREKFAEVERKLADVDKMIASSSAYEKNLETLEKEEQSILSAVSALTADAISGLTSLTAKRKETLKRKIQFFADQGNRLSELREVVKQLSAEDFLTQRSEIDRQCDDMMSGYEPNCALESVDDFKCDLVPAFKIAKFTCAGFATAAANYVFKMHSAFDVTWNVTITKSEMLQLKLSPGDPGITKFYHKLLVIISHEDPTKEIRRAFDLGGAFQTFGIVQMSHLTELGFFNLTGGFMLKIGIRPLNALVEKMLLHYNCKKLKAECTSLRKQLGSITSGFDYKYLSAHLKLSLAKLEVTSVERYGTTIVDDDGRLWGVKVLPTMVYQRPTQVEAYVVLIKGSATNCNYYIELKHLNAPKTVVKSGSNYFNRRDAHGWKCFITWNNINDVGFHADGNLLFRYGIKPLKN